MLVASATAHAGPSLPAPRPKTEEEKLAFLISVQEQVPNLFEDAARFDIDLLKLVEDQSELRKLLERDPAYVRAIRERAPYLDLSIRPPSNTVVQERKIKPEALASWKAELQGGLKNIHLNPGGLAESALLAQIKANLDKLQGRSSNGLLTGLIQSLPKELRTQAFRAQDFESKIRILNESLADPLPPEFKSEIHGLRPGVGKKEGLDLLQDLRQLETRLRNQVELHLVLQGVLEGKAPVSMDELAAKLRELKMSDLEFFADRDALAPRLLKLEARLGLNSKQLSGVAAQVQAHIGSFTAQTETVLAELGDGLKLSEVPPQIGIFRGCTGGDCSSQFSFPYPNAPNERVYFVHSPDGRIKGYVTGAIVEANGKKTLNVLTIAGSRISSADTKMILSGLHEARAQIGVEQLSLPASGFESLINYEPIRAVYRDVNQAGEKAQIKFVDKESRQKIEAFKSEYNRGHYDHMAQQSDVTVFDPEKHAGLRLQVEADPHPARFALRKTVSRQEVLSFALDLIHSGREKQLEQVLRIKKIDKSKVDALKAALENPQKKPLAEYRADLQARLKSLGAEVSILDKKSYLTFAGRLQSPDVLSGEPGRTVILAELIQELKSSEGGIPDSSIAAFLRARAAELAEQPEIQKYLAKLARSSGDFESVALQWLMSHSIQLRDPEDVLELLTRLAQKGKTSALSESEQIVINLLIKTGPLTAKSWPLVPELIIRLDDENLDETLESLQATLKKSASDLAPEIKEALAQSIESGKLKRFTAVQATPEGAEAAYKDLQKAFRKASAGEQEGEFFKLMDATLRAESESPAQARAGMLKKLGSVFAAKKDLRMPFLEKIYLSLGRYPSPASHGIWKTLLPRARGNSKLLKDLIAKRAAQLKQELRARRYQERNVDNGSFESLLDELQESTPKSRVGDVLTEALEEAIESAEVGSYQDDIRRGAGTIFWRIQENAALSPQRLERILGAASRKPSHVSRHMIWSISLDKARWRRVPDQLAEKAEKSFLESLFHPITGSDGEIQRIEASALKSELEDFLGFAAESRHQEHLESLLQKAITADHWPDKEKIELISGLSALAEEQKVPLRCTQEVASAYSKILESTPMRMGAHDARRAISLLEAYPALLERALPGLERALVEEVTMGSFGANFSTRKDFEAAWKLIQEIVPTSRRPQVAKQLKSALLKDRQNAMYNPRISSLKAEFEKWARAKSTPRCLELTGSTLRRTLETLEE